MISASALPHGAQRARQGATRLIFLIAGVGLASWAPLVPYVKERFALNEGTLGLLLLCLGAGSILAMPVTGPLVARFGCRRVIVVATLLAATCLPLLAAATLMPVLAISLLLFGGGIGSLDVAMNLQAVTVERDSGRTMMSGFHGLFSLGSILGAGVAIALLAGGLSPLITALVLVATLLAALAVACPGLIADAQGAAAGPVFAVPRGVVLVMGLVCFVSFLTEGAMLDWAAVLLAEHRGVPTAYAGAAYAVFCLAMTLGRLQGDRWIQRLGAVRVVACGGVLAAGGILLMCLVPAWPVTLFGCGLAGLGCANIVPVMFSSAGRQTLMPESVAVPAVATLGYAGVLAGPAVIGLIAGLSSLVGALLLLSALLLIAAAASRWTR
ncbi:MFS transporter [Halomonas sp. V046]|uniref:MFS transporter n=1 Tax=Halomonas sp. V046 TaxID=3459611 RepID=UPI004044FE0B